MLLPLNDFNIKEGRRRSWIICPPPPPREGDSRMKQTGMLVVWLRGVNFGFWSRLGCSVSQSTLFKHGKWLSKLVFRHAKRQYFMPPRSRLGFRKETQNYAGLFFFFDDYVLISLKRITCRICVCFKRSLLGVKICLSHAQIGLL